MPLGLALGAWDRRAVGQPAEAQPPLHEAAHRLRPSKAHSHREVALPGQAPQERTWRGAHRRPCARQGRREAEGRKQEDEERKQEGEQVRQDERQREVVWRGLGI